MMPSNPAHMKCGTPVPTALYRLFGAGYELLYVGASTQPQKRFREHSWTQKWWHLVAHREVGPWLPTFWEARDLEDRVIYAECPRFNGLTTMPGYYREAERYDDTAEEMAVAAAVCAGIERGDLRPGDLVRARSLSEQLGVSPITANHALRALQRSELVLGGRPGYYTVLSDEDRRRRRAERERWANLPKYVEQRDLFGLDLM